LDSGTAGGEAQACVPPDAYRPSAPKPRESQQLECPLALAECECGCLGGFAPVGMPKRAIRREVSVALSTLDAGVATAGFFHEQGF